MSKRNYIRLNVPQVDLNTINWSETAITVPLGSTIIVDYINVSNISSFSGIYIENFLNGIATADTTTFGSVAFTGASIGTATIPTNSEVGVTNDGASVYTGNILEITVTAPVEDQNFLNERGLTHFWENIDALKQDRLTAGTNITISSDSTISASQPTVGNGTLTIQKNGTNVQTFTANQGTNATANITVPTKTSDLTNDAGFIDAAAIADKQNLLSPGDHIDITSDVISATGYVRSENPQASAAASSTVTGSMIANGTITADKLATGATVKLTMSTSDIGEGAPLAANTLYGVYI